MRRAVLTFALVGALLCSARRSALAQSDPSREAQGYSLADVARVVVRTHPALAAARANVRAAEYDILGAGLWTNPQFSAVYTRSVGFTTFDPVLGFLQAGVTQQIETSNAPAARRRVAEVERDATRLDGLATRQGLVLDAHENFVRGLEAWTRREALTEHLARLERGATIIEARVGAGMAPVYDRTRVQLALAAARAQLGDADADVERTRTDLEAAVGSGVDALQGRPLGDLFASPELPARAELTHTALDARADVAALQTRSRGSIAAGEVARRGVFPGIALYGGFAIGQGYGTNGERQFDLLVGATVPMPFVDRAQGRVQAATARAEAQALAAQALVEQLHRRALGALREVERRRETLAAFERTAPERARAVAEAEAAYREAHIPVAGLIDAWEAVRDARLRAIELALETRVAEVTLWRSVARLPGDPALASTPARPTP